MAVSGVVLPIMGKITGLDGRKFLLPALSQLGIVPCVAPFVVRFVIEQIQKTNNCQVFFSKHGIAFISQLELAFFHLQYIFGILVFVRFLLGY